MEFKLPVSMEDLNEGSFDHECDLVIYTPQIKGAHNQMLCFDIKFEDPDKDSMGFELNKNEALYLRNIIDAFINEKEIDPIL